VILYPAIDLKDGQCVRLLRGDMGQATVFNTDPPAQARAFASQGFSWIHVVDLNGAFEGAPVNGDAVEGILGAVDLNIQLGGGIRTMETIEFWLAKGVARVVLGTVALRDPDLVRRACKQFPGKIAVGLDSRNGFVAIEGWAESTDRMVLDVAKDFADAGVAAIIHTDIDRDGVLTGVNVGATATLAQAQSIPVIASGGVSSLDDIRALLKVENTGIEGVIAGRAIYDGRLDPVEALALLAA
jgi:phosphoribosylformimino-5-aminoimidazole carboxamide ribotide isomerase